MCTIISLRATDDRGKPRKDIEPIEFQVPGQFTPDYPTCTCGIALDDPDGVTLRHTFADTVLKEMLKQVNFGNIVIELR